MALADNALTTVAAVEAVVGDGQYTDARIEQLINAVSAAVERVTGRQFALTVVDTNEPEYYQGNGRTQLCLDRFPIVSVQRVRIDGVEITDYSRTPQLDRIGILYRLSGWPIAAPRHYDLTEDTDRSLLGYNIDIAYTAGYDLAGADRTLPYDLEQIVIDEVVRKLARPIPGLVSERTPGGHAQTWSQQAAGGDLSAEAHTALRRWTGRHFG